MSTVQVREDLGALRPAWDELVEVRPIPTPFLRTWWLDAVGRRQPRYVLLMEGRDLVGGLALEEDRPLGVTRLRTLGSEMSPDHIGIVAMPGREADVATAIATWLARPGDRLLDLVSVYDHGGLLDQLAVPVGRQVEDLLPYIDLDGTFDTYFQGLSRNLRREIRRRQRDLESEGLHSRIVALADFDRALATLRDLHQRQFGARSLFLPHFETFARAAHAGAQLGELRLHELVTDHGVVATHVHFDVAGTVSAYQAGRRTEPQYNSAMHILIGQAIKWAYENGRVRLDLLRGAAPYKLRFATAQHDLVRATAAVGPRARGVARALPVAFRARQRVRDARTLRARQVHELTLPSGRAG